MRPASWHRFFIAFSLIAGVSPIASVRADSENDAGGWTRDLETAIAEAERLNRPLVVHFFAEWCVPCRRMDRDVLSSPELKQQFDRSFVGVKVDADRHPELLKKFGVRSLPADVVVSPEGKVLIQTRGYQTKDNYVGRLARLGERLQPKGLQNEAPRSQDTMPAKSNPQNTEQPAFAPLPGLDGYSPVSLHTWREWRKGKPEFTAYHKGIPYQMISRDELNEFIADPDKYVPRLLGCDPVILQKTDRAVPGNTKYGAYYEGKLYLFQSPETRAEFKKSPTRFVKTRHVLNVDDIDRGIRQSKKPADTTVK